MAVRYSMSSVMADGGFRPRLGREIFAVFQGLDGGGRSVVRPLWVARLAAVAALACVAAEGVVRAVPDPADAERVFTDALRRAEGRWRDLFDGRSLAGWRVAAKPVDRVKPWWRVEEGVIVADSTNDPNHDYVWLLSEEEFADFVLEFEFRTPRGLNGNSGVQFRSRYDADAGWLDGPQVDIHPPAPWRTGFIHDETQEVRAWISPRLARVGDVRPEMAGGPAPFRYAGDPEEWNRMRIIAIGGRVLVELNGVLVRDAMLEDVLFDEVHARRRVGRRGHLALQIHARDALRIEFRRLRIAAFDDESR